MKFFYADALDLVDPGFDFENDEFAPGRVPQRDDVYAHELMAPERPYDGLLVSRFLLDGLGSQGRYTMAQRQRFIREGAQRFLRFPATGEFQPDEFPILCDCGAFNYRNDPEPPYSVEDMVDFYELGGFTHGVSVDHMIGAYDPMLDHPTIGGIPDALQKRFDITMANAERLRQIVVRDPPRFTAIGVAQGWSPASYASAVKALIAMGYDYVALGGLVPLKTPEILAVLRAVREVTAGKTRLHLFGVTRLENFDAFRAAGVASFDSTSPLRQAFKDAKDNYYATSGHYSAIRIPQADSYPKLVRRIRKGEVDRLEAVRAEKACLQTMRALDEGEATVSEALGALGAYESLFGGRSKWDAVARTLRDRPWKDCTCPVCREIGVEVVIFRGANRNRRRGFHNLHFTQQLLDEHRARVASDD